MINITATDLQALLDDAITTAVERAMEMLERDYGEQDPEDRLPPGSLEARPEEYELSPEDEAYLESLDLESPEMQIHEVRPLPDEDFDFEDLDDAAIK